MDMGRYLDGFFGSLPGLGIGITVASFQHSGISPEAHISLNISSNTISESLGRCFSS